MPTREMDPGAIQCPHFVFSWGGGKSVWTGVVEM